MPALGSKFMLRQLSLQRITRGLGLALLALLFSAGAAAQSDDGVSLADVARALRAKKAAAGAVVIDNDNMVQVMDQAAAKKKVTALESVIEHTSRKYEIISPDATCSLTFDANASMSPSAVIVPSELPPADLAKVDGPASLDGGILRIAVHNGSHWNLREITVALTILEADTRDQSSALKLLPAAQSSASAAKRPDSTRLLHLKGAAAPSATAVFQEKLGEVFPANQDWRWAILEAKGIPSDEVATAINPASN